MYGFGTSCIRWLIQFSRVFKIDSQYLIFLKLAIYDDIPEKDLYQLILVHANRQ